jgi:hypothetical protein
MSNEDVKKSLEVEENLEKDIESQEKISDSLVSVEVRLVEDIPEKISFLRKVGVKFFYYFLFCILVTVLLMVDQRRSREISRIFNLHTMVWIFLTVSVVIKFSVSVLPFLRNWARSFFVLDMIVTFFIVVGLFFYLEEYQREHGIAHGYIYILYVWTMFSTNIIFLICTTVKSRKIFNPLYAILFMTIFSVITVFILSRIWSTQTVDKGKYFWVLLPVFFINAYICINSFYLVNYRTTKFYEDEDFYCYFCYYTDFLWPFWRDSFKNIKFRKNRPNQTNQTNKQKNKKQKSKLQSKKNDHSNFEADQKKNKIDVLKKSKEAKKKPKKNKKQKKVKAKKEFANE